MNDRESLLKCISTEFTKWQIQLENLNSLSLYDANIFSEYTLCELLNVVFDYGLINANVISTNFPAVDLVDDENRMAIQVTSSSSKTKIQTTIEKFVEYQLFERYDQLIIIVLGKRQNYYRGLVLPTEFHFNPDEQIMDFRSLLKKIAILPLIKMQKILKVLIESNPKLNSNKANPNAALIKKRLAIKKRIERDFLRDVDQKHWKQLRHEPWIRFVYHNVIIRSIDDKTWPEMEEPEKGKMSSWFKGEFWNLYENGIELIAHGRTAIFDKDGNWDSLKWDNDSRKGKDIYEEVDYNLFLRIPYDFIVEYDLDPDPYNGCPTIYVEYAKDNMPYEEILYGIAGRYNAEHPSDSTFTYYFDNTKRKDLP